MQLDCKIVPEMLSQSWGSSAFQFLEDFVFVQEIIPALLVGGWRGAHTGDLVGLLYTLSQILFMSNTWTGSSESLDFVLFKPILVLLDICFRRSSSIPKSDVTIDHEPHFLGHVWNKEGQIGPLTWPAGQNKALGAEVLHVIIHTLQLQVALQRPGKFVSLCCRAPIDLQNESNLDWKPWPKYSYFTRLWIQIPNVDLGP